MSNSRMVDTDTAEGSTLPEIFGNNDKWSSQHAAIVHTRLDHIVLYHVPYKPGEVPIPQQAKQQGIPGGWGRDHVRLPCSTNNKYVDNHKNSKLKWELIEESLLKTICSTRELEEAIKSYNPKYNRKWSFSALHKLFYDVYPPEFQVNFFAHILPAIIAIALQLPQLIPGSIPLLKCQDKKSISMSQQQAVCILANAFLCTFPMRNENGDGTKLPTINFNRLYGSTEKPVLEKLKCIINYFCRVLREEMPKNVITFQRCSYRQDTDWTKVEKTFSQTKFRVTSDGTIEDGHGMLQVDFANRLVGGGVLGHGCVQEEIRFVINPEMIVARLFTESLEDNEALVMIGCEQFSTYRGYSSTFEFVKNFKDETPLDFFGRRNCRVVAIDALPYDNYDKQFKKETLCRELTKANAGFQNFDKELDSSPVATGLWGCGAFNGHIIRSALIQLMACTMNDRNIVLYTFGDTNAKKEISGIYDFLKKKKVTVGKLYQLLIEFGKRKYDPNILINFIKEKITNVQPSSVKTNKKPPVTIYDTVKYDAPSNSATSGSDSSKANNRAKH